MGKQIIFFDNTPAIVKAARDYGWESIEFSDINDFNQSNYIKSVLEQGPSSLRAR